MSPNPNHNEVANRIHTPPPVVSHKEPGSLEILYQGYYYDVTNFIKKHPGGSVILYYTEKGEDATQAIQQFHNRSINKIELMLKSFKKRPATDDEVNMDPKKLNRHRALTNDFAKLFVDMQKEGLFEPSYWRVGWRILESCFFWYLSYILIFSPNIVLKILGCCCNAMGSGRAGWLMHEGGHHSLTGKPKVDRLLESVLFGVFWGLSGGWWNRTHIKHHAMPQRLHHDQDLDTLPFLTYNSKVVKDPKQAKNFFVQNQSWLFLSLDCAICHLSWTLYSCPRYIIKYKDYIGFLMMAIHWTANYAMIPDILSLLFIYWLRATYIIGNFTLSHTHRPVTEEPTHWVEYALTHTTNIQQGLLVDWWMGYLNLHIEHHLFPTLPEFRSYLIRDRVKALADKHGLPYETYSFIGAWMKTLKNFSNVAKEFNY